MEEEREGRRRGVGERHAAKWGADLPIYPMDICSPTQAQNGASKVGLMQLQGCGGPGTRQRGSTLHLTIPPDWQGLEGYVLRAARF